MEIEGEDSLLILHVQIWKKPLVFRVAGSVEEALEVLFNMVGKFIQLSTTLMRIIGAIND